MQIKQQNIQTTGSCGHNTGKAGESKDTHVADKIVMGKININTHIITVDEATATLLRLKRKTTLGPERTQI